MSMCRVWRRQNKPQALFHNKNSNSIFALSKIFLMGAMKLPSEDVSCHEGLWQWMERFRKHSSKPMLFLVHASCSASFRRLKPPLRLPGDQKCLC